MAADNRSIVITLKLDEGQNSENQNPTNTASTQQSSDKNSSAKAVASFAAVQAAQLVANEAVAWAEYYNNRELTLADDYIGQRNKKVATTQIQRGVNALSTIGSMTASGASVGGWVGAVVGAVLGTVTVAVGAVRSNLQGQEQQEIQVRQMNAQLQFTRSRVGWSTQAASIGEDL